MKHFVFLEFTNPRVREFLSDLRSAFNNKDLTTSVHITVRGPYEEPPNQSTLEPLKERMRGYILAIGGAGIFKTPKGYVVYLKVTSPVFEEIWWKPDYKDEGINPHITIYETKNQLNANAVERFLKSEKIDISTFSFTLTSYTSKQAELFEESIDSRLEEKISSIEKWKVKRGIIERAKLLKEQLL
jgi:hypothetical protein